MTVHIDNAMLPFGRMRMCHMIADSREELDAMADCIGISHKWRQKSGTSHEHYDVCLSKRALAIKVGAQEVCTAEMAMMLRARAAK